MNPRRPFHFLYSFSHTFLFFSWRRHLSSSFYAWGKKSWMFWQSFKNLVTLVDVVCSDWYVKLPVFDFLHQILRTHRAWALKCQSFGTAYHPTPSCSMKSWKKKSKRQQRIMNRIHFSKKNKRRLTRRHSLGVMCIYTVECKI